MSVVVRAQLTGLILTLLQNIHAVIKVDPG